MPQNGGNASVLVFLLIPLLLIGWMMWTTSKRQKALAKFQSELSVGRRVVTTSGLFGTITALGDATASLEIAPGVVVDFDRRAVGMLAEVGAGQDETKVVGTVASGAASQGQSVSLSGDGNKAPSGRPSHFSASVFNAPEALAPDPCHRRRTRSARWPQ